MIRDYYKDRDDVKYFEYDGDSFIAFLDGGPIGHFICPGCGNKIRSPYGGHKWKCHEVYGGCGKVFKPTPVTFREQ